jgi:hypothetical protein
MNPARVDQALARLRVELFTAAQVLKGEQLDELKQLIRDVCQVLELDVLHALRIARPGDSPP